jgi:predicted DNA-binding transcriptional regulator AlpA
LENNMHADHSISRPITLAATASPPDEWLSTARTAKILCLSVQTVRELAKHSPDFPRPYRPGNRNLRWRQGDILNWQKSRMVPRVGSGG